MISSHFNKFCCPSSTKDCLKYLSNMSFNNDSLSLSKSLIDTDNAPRNLTPHAAKDVRTGMPEAIASCLASAKLSPCDKRQNIDAFL